MKLRDWTEKWLTEYMVNLIRPETIANYRRESELHIYPYIGDYPISKITTIQIQRMYNDYCAIIGLNQKDLENQGILA